MELSIRPDVFIKRIIMKIIFCTTFFSMMTFCALGQRPDPGQFTGRIEDYYNFFGVSKSVNDEWIEEVHNSDTLTMIEIVNDLDHKIIAARRFFNNTHIISEEYLRLEKDTFMYISYSPESHKITSQGVVVPSICCELIDTLITTDPETYETVFWLERYWNFSKERHWKYTYNEYYYSQGNYENNRRVGEWYERDSSGHIKLLSAGTNRGCFAFITKEAARNLPRDWRSREIYQPIDRFIPSSRYRRRHH